MTSAKPLSPRRPVFKAMLLWAALALLTPGLRLVNLVVAPEAQTVADAGSDLPDLETVFADVPRYYAYAQAILGRPYDSYYIRPVEGWREDRGPPHRLVTPDHALTPWRDFSFEYPPGALAAILPPALLTGGLVSYCLVFSLEMSLFLTGALWLGVRAAERLRPGAGLTTLQLGVVYFMFSTLLVSWHYDALVALTLAGFAYGTVAALPLLAGLSLAAAIAVKGAPVLLIPIALTHVLLASPWRRVAGAAAAGGLVLAGVGAVYLRAAGAHALDMFAYHAGRPVQIESLYGAVALIVQTLGGARAHLVESFGSVNVEDGLQALAAPLTALAALEAIGWRLWRLGRSDDATTRARRTLAASAAALIAYMVFGKVFSPQYVVWLFPLALIPAVVAGGAAPLMLLGSVLLTQIEFPFVYANSLSLLGFVVLARDAMLLATAGCLMAGAARRPVLAENEGEATPLAPASVQV
jgi:hypothetical protein